MKILIVGAGGIGGYFRRQITSRLARILLLLRKAAKAHSRARSHYGTPKGNMTIQPHTILASQLEPVYDLIILACKAFDLNDALQSIAKASSKGYILPFLNGFTHLKTLDHHFQ
jgi:2-dehydropantoate 2-reductase